VATIWLLTDLRYLEQRMPHAVAGWLESAGSPPRVVVADESRSTQLGRDASGAWRGLELGDLVVVRSRHPYALALLEVAEAIGARALDSSAAISRVRDKVHCTIALARRGIPVPPTFLASRPDELERLPASAYPLILKPVLGDNARGLRVVGSRRELAEAEWPEDLVLAQSYLDAGGVDLKIYVAGEAIWAVRRPSPLTEATDEPVPAQVTSTLRDLANVCRDEFDLRLFGLDVLELPGGPVVVDVNEFPNYTGVDDAPAEIGRMVVELGAPPRTATERVLVRT
jgi:ribosomal protein S6--L-glutamate ligase